MVTTFDLSKKNKMRNNVVANESITGSKYIYMEEEKTLRVARVEEKNCQGLYSSILGFFRMILIDWFFF